MRYVPPTGPRPSDGGEKPVTGSPPPPPGRFADWPPKPHVPEPGTPPAS